MSAPAKPKSLFFQKMNIKAREHAKNISKGYLELKKLIEENAEAGEIKFERGPDGFPFDDQTLNYLQEEGFQIIQGGASRMGVSLTAAIKSVTIMWLNE